MKWIKKFESSLKSENDKDFVITKIKEHFKKEEVINKLQNEDEFDIDTALLDMICWFEDEYDKEIENEDLILNILRQEYDLK
jgi:hypothetical protein